MQLLAKFKKILYMGFRATLNFRKFKVALNPVYRICLNFAKSCISSCLSKFYNKKKFHSAVFVNISAERCLLGHSIAMVTYSVMKIIPTFSAIIGQCLDTIIVASTDKKW